MDSRQARSGRTRRSAGCLSSWPSESARRLDVRTTSIYPLPKMSPDRALGPILETIGSLTERILDYDRKLEAISKEHYPETDLLRQVEGVGGLTALTFVLTLEDPHRFERSRFVGAYLGLVPASDQSGDRDPQRRISKEGDEMLRKLLVGMPTTS